MKLHCERPTGETVKAEWCFEGNKAHEILMGLEVNQDERGIYIHADSVKKACPRLSVAGNIDHDVMAALLVSGYQSLAKAAESLKKSK